MKTLSLVPVLAIGGLITFLSVFSPLSKMIQSEVEMEMTAEMKYKIFQEFLSNFEDIALPYEVEQPDFTKYINGDRDRSEIYKSDKRINRDFKVFIPKLGARFSRMGPDIYLYEAVLANNKDHAAVIYSVHAPYRDYPMYVLATYTASGDLVSETTLAHRSYDELILGNIDAQKNIVIKTYTFDYNDGLVVYERPIPTSALVLERVETWKITKTGAIEDVSTAMIDDAQVEDRSK